MGPNGVILVGTDGSASAEAAMVWAGELARAVGSGVRVVHCAPEHLAGGEDDAALSQAVRRWSAPAAQEGVDVDELLVHGDPRQAIPDLVADSGPDLVVLGARGEGGFAQLALGRVARHVLHHVDVPVAIVPHSGGAVAAGVVVVGVDGSRANRPAVEWAVDVAARTGGRTDAVFVHDPMADSYGHGDISNWKYRGQAHAEQLLDSVVQAAKGPVSAAFVNRAGHPVETLAEVAAEREASMIVIGTRGHWSLGGRVLGHVAAQLPEHGPCPVVVVPHT